MKKISTIIALALVITIGGVFAAWHYNRGEVSLEMTRSATMASIQSDTAKGSIAIDQDANNGQGNTLKFLVDDVAPQDYVTTLVPSGSVWVKFTPAANADQAVKDNGIKMKATITVLGTQQEYNGVKIFAAAASNEIMLGEATLDAVEIKATDIVNCLIFNGGETIVLDTYEDNLAYETAMKTYMIAITITEAA